ncbi:putative late blight resistance protein homolog R1B-16 [Solanum dulcamara]|uniref:putative late blight resistance protein homolog R1B-16 n=1 Tax=Solanum dulcamara TaxID=45834 RepID=UPI002485CEAE|nr:putative late blight resistance protein homolog R1B-16 [Solanum dulcamara]
MAYAAITSLMRTIHQSMQLTGYNLQSFYERFESLRSILEKNCLITGHLEALTSLEGEITELVCSTEDLVDSESRKVFLAENEITRKIEFWELRFVLKQALLHIDSAINKWLETRLDMEDVKLQILTLPSASQYAFEPDEENMMVGHENEFEMMQDQLARGTRELQVVSIVGIGGIGKTTLANKIYNDPFIMSRFDIRAKAIVSQGYCARVVLIGLLSCIIGKTDEFHEQHDDGELADRLQKLLKGRRYLVVIDDIWTKGAWDDIKLCLSESNCGSRILLTTRDMKVAEYANLGNPPYRMRFMNFDESWSLLCEKVFAKAFFPSEFEQLGKQIALECKGLPLAIVVIAGLLSKIGKTLNEWKGVAENVSSMVSTNLDDHCSRVLALSYHHLPQHLKSCFLYFAIFPEDEVIFVDKLMELWVVEGFLKVEETKSIKEMAEKYLKDLIDRSLVFVHHLSFDGKLKSCRIHDVIREFCLKEARNLNFLNDNGGKNEYQTTPYAQSMHIASKRRGRISIQNGEELARCGNSSEACAIFLFYRYRGFKPELSRFKLVRVLDLALLRCFSFPSWILDLIHLRYLALTLSPGLQSRLGEDIPSSLDIPLSISSLHYLQTFILKVSHHEISRYPFILPSDILTIPQLSHLCLDWNYLRYHEHKEKSLVLKNLLSLFGWNPLFCTWSVFRLLPNLKKLQICGIREDFRRSKDILYFRYLDQLEELEFRIAGPRDLPPEDDFPPLLLPSPGAFPENLKNLALSGTCLLLEDLSIIAKLPKLEALKLEYDACVGMEWEVVKEGFPCLKYLLLKRLSIWYWRADSTHFPCLERLFVKACWYLDSIPQDFAQITTLELIDIRGCAQSVGNSAKQIQHDIEDYYASSVEVCIS